MTTKLADTRDMTLAHARDTFKQIALIEKRVAHRAALTEKRIAATKKCHAARIQEDLHELEGLERDLTTFILCNRHLFQRPRSVKTDFGKFGLEAVSNVDILDKEKIIEHALGKRKPDLIKQSVTVKKAAVGKRLRDGETIPGASLSIGERAFYKVDKALIDEAKASAVDTPKTITVTDQIAV